MFFWILLFHVNLCAQTIWILFLYNIIILFSIYMNLHSPNFTTVIRYSALRLTDWCRCVLLLVASSSQVDLWGGKCRCGGGSCSIGGRQDGDVDRHYVYVQAAPATDVQHRVASTSGHGQRAGRLAGRRGRSFHYQRSTRNRAIAEIHKGGAAVLKVGCKFFDPQLLLT